MHPNGNNQNGANGHHPNGSSKATEKTAIAAGGASSSLDMSNERDRAAVREAMKRWPRRWRGLSEEFKDEIVGGLNDATKASRRLITKEDLTLEPETVLKAVAAIASCARTAVMMEGQQQADDHENEKYNRLDEGSASSIHEHRHIVVKFDDKG